MSTRGCIGFRLNGKDCLSYNHSDSYPGWLGRETLKQLKKWQKGCGWAALREQVENWKGLQPFGLRADGRDSNNNWYEVLRAAHGDLKRLLELGYYIEDSAFMGASLFCEWAYVIDLDTKKFEIYKGFQKEKHDGRYGHLTADRGYFGVKLVKSYSLSRLPAEEGFLKESKKWEK